ncbi:LysR substrate-binding domain-containing protein [Aliiruegeria lutimaris]|uniref:Transcriptional regulator, LysR family n=1 Tax=Aliiruegeria lutimaris TaxID=571298 RepID=A0A1G9D9J3_9RHOB|nr:LysR substrate-binding domain-containing protein [Aliiruegeria lutimaris]SDK60579.1 transcriptional regulator, LysR family [Aliiruegeria lutimaris]
MEVKWLLDFLSLVDTRNFSRSADDRATTQPAFSRRIKALEEWLGAPMFDRSKQPIELTEAGRRFKPVADEVLRRLFQSREEIQRIGQRTESTITFAATHSLSLVFFPNWIRGVEKELGQLRTRLDSKQIRNCVQSLVRGECNFALLPTHTSVEVELSEEEFISLPVGLDRLVPVSAPDETGAPRHALPGTQKAPLDYLSYFGSAVSGRAVEVLLREKGNEIHLRRVFETHLAGVLKSMAVEGRGVAWLPQSEVVTELEAGSLVYAGDNSWNIASEIRLFRSRDPLPNTAEAFWKYLDDAASASS